MARVQSKGDEDLVRRLRAREEAAFGELIDRYHHGLLHVARSYVSSRESAEDVVQEAMLGVLQGIDRFEGRSSLRTWLFRILVNRAQTRGEREGRIRPFSSLAESDHEPAVDPDRFAKSGRWIGCWTAPPCEVELPEASVLAGEMGARLLAAIAALPPAQRAVLELRDVQGFSAAEVCELLEVSEVNQRVLLHRARSAARAHVERYLLEASR